MLVPRTGNPRSARGRAAPQGTAGRGLAPGDGAYEYVYIAVSDISTIGARRKVRVMDELELIGVTIVGIRIDRGKLVQ